MAPQKRTVNLSDLGSSRRYAIQLVSDWIQISKVGVPPGRIVKAFDVGVDGFEDRGTRGEVFTTDSLLFEASKEGLRYSVIVAVFRGAHVLYRPFSRSTKNLNESERQGGV